MMVVPMAVVAASLVTGSGSAQAVTVGAGTNGTVAGESGCEVVLVSPLIAPPPSCTFFDGTTAQTPRGNWRVRSVSVRTGPRTGPVRFTMVQALRSRAGAQGIICCSASAQSQVFTPAPNRVTTVPVNMKAVNTVELIDGEQVEVVDYLGISLLNQRSAIAFRPAQIPATSYFTPAFALGATRLPGAVGYSVTPMIQADLTACAGSSAADASVSAGCAAAGFSVARRMPLSRGGTRARLTVRVPGRGIVIVRGSVGGRKLVAAARRKAAKAGKLAVFAKLNRRGRAVLRRRGRFNVRVKVRYRPADGKAKVKRLKVRFARG